MVGYINKIETMGLADGPGVRTVVFMQGCPLRCVFCDNPETWEFSKEKEYTVDNFCSEVIKYKNYYGDNGGVTFSGGEPLYQTEFLLEVSKILKKENINICLDTSGIGYDYNELLDYIDLVILDVKHFDENEYYKITGLKMDNFFQFIEDCNEKNKDIWIRQVIIPGINDNTEYILELKKFIKMINNVKKIELLPYHTLGIDKYKELKLNNPLDKIKPMNIVRCRELEKLLNSN